MLNGEIDLDPAIIEEFDKIKTKLHDEDYDKLEVDTCDVNTIQNIPKGVPGFWLRAILANH